LSFSPAKSAKTSKSHCPDVHSRLHTAKILRLSEDLPVLIEIVDKEDRIQAFLPELDRMVGDGLVTLEKVRIIAYRASPPAAPGGGA
jgi:Uncharacterized ACR, COG1993